PLRHLQPDQRVFPTKELGGERLGQLGLADASGAHEEERADWTVGVLQARTRAADGTGDSADGLVLTDDALAQVILQVAQVLALSLEHLADGHPRPALDNPSNVFRRHQRGRRLASMGPRLVQLGLELYLTLAQLCRPLVLLGERGSLLLLLEIAELTLERADHLRANKPGFAGLQLESRRRL